MNFSLASVLNDTANRLKSVAGDLRSSYFRPARSRTEERLHELASTLDQVLSSINGSLRTFRSATAPYMNQVADAASPYLARVADKATPYIERVADSASTQADAVRESLAANAKAVAKAIKRRGPISRHPFAIAIAVTGVTYLAVRSWRMRKNASSTMAKRRAARPAATGARATRSTKSVTKSAATRVRPKRARNGSAVLVTPDKAVH